MPKRLILASASAARARLLRAAGLDIVVDPAVIEEAKLKQVLRADGAARCAAALAEAKAVAVSTRCPGALVIGADQLLVVDDEWFDKPTSLAEAQAQLRQLRGRIHQLVTAACVVCDGDRLWQTVSTAQLTMRPFSDEFLDTYVAGEGAALLGSVGAYCLEGRGIQLFSRVEGDHFAIQGLPLIELLGFLRHSGALQS